jgi:hypothetical protein
MSTSFSWQGTHGIARNFCSVHHKLIQSSCVSKLSEQNLDGMQQHHDFHNINCQSIFLADGTEHSYFTLPADYQLEQSTSPVSHSTAEMLVLQPHRLWKHKKHV